MIKTLIQVFTFLLFFGHAAMAQPKVQLTVFVLDNKKNITYSDTIYHNAARQLTWDDFQGLPIDASEAGAVTASGFAYTATVKSTKQFFRINIYIYTFFNKKNSWKKPKIMSDYHLRHEQLHFDITRIAAENFKIMLNSVIFTKENYPQMLKNVWFKAQDSWTLMQKAYDEETNHSIRKKDQKRWNNFVEEEIKKLYPTYNNQTASIRP